MQSSVQVYLKIVTVCGLLLVCRGNFVSSPSSEKLQTPLKKSIELMCKFEGATGVGDFLEWYADDKPVSSEKPGHYLVQATPTETILRILIFVTADEQVKEWYVTTTKSTAPDGKACRFGKIKLVPSPQEMYVNGEKKPFVTDKESIRRVEDEPIEFTCGIKPTLESTIEQKKILWQYSLHGEEFGTALPSGVETEGNRLTIANVKKSHRGYYRCTLNNVAFSIQLRVKDRLAALWPFLGIVGVVLVLVIIIIIFEKRQKSTQNAATTDEEDHANDPLVRQTNKASDNENKKRAVKA